MDGVRVDERDLEPEQARSWPLVDEVGAGAAQVSQGCIEVAHLVRDVVHARPSLGQEATNRSVLPQRLEQLHPSVTDPHRRRTDALVLHRRTVLNLGSEQALVRRQRGVEIFDGNAHMMDSPGLHGG